MNLNSYPDIGATTLLLGPAVAIAILVLLFVRGALRSRGGAALLAVILGVTVLAALGGGATFLSRFYLLNQLIPDCLAAERAAREAGEAALYDCEAQGIALSIPVFWTTLALVIFLVGALVIRVTARRG